MSNSTNIYQNNPKTKIIARLYTNPRFGKGIGNKRVNRFIFNGALEFPQSGTKLWVDLPEIEYSKTSCKITDHALLSQVAYGIIRNNWKADPYEEERFLFGQLFDLKPKTWVKGFLLFDLNTAQAIVVMLDEETEDILWHEEFPITPVHTHTDKKAPDYFGVNYDMDASAPVLRSSADVTDLGTTVDTGAVLEKLKQHSEANL